MDNPLDSLRKKLLQTQEHIQRLERIASAPSASNAEKDFVESRVMEIRAYAEGVRAQLGILQENQNGNS